MISTRENWADYDVIDLRAIVARLWARRWWVVLSVLVFTTLLTTAAFVITPVYRATTLLIASSPEQSNLSGSLSSALGVGSLASLAGITLGSGDSATQEALGVLRSRQFTERFIVEMNLLPKLFSDRWDSNAGKWKVAPEQQPTLAKAYKYFDGVIRTVTQDKKTGLVILQVDWKDPDDATSWANELVRRLNAEMRGRAISSSEASVEFLEKELSDTSLVETRAAINRLIEAQIRQRMLANVTHEFAFRVVDKAMPPDRDDPVKPRKLLLIAAGPLVGFIIGVIGVLAFEWMSASIRTPREWHIPEKG